MKRVELEVFSDASNHAVIRPAGRSFPGSVVQGDSLSILCAEAKELSERISSLGVKDKELLYLAQDHQEKLVPTRNGEAPLLAAHSRRWAFEG